MKEDIVITLTTWEARINNIPIVLDTIFSQQQQPNYVVLNVSYDLKIPEYVNSYLTDHYVLVNRVEDTKVYKKILPTLRLFPDACIINIDDDWLYPPTMISDFMESHNRHPNNPISGNKVVSLGMKCHCGCASLLKREFIGEYLDYIDENVIKNCPSDDILFTYFCTRNNHPYLTTKYEYFYNMKCIEDQVGYTNKHQRENIDYNTFIYLSSKFGFLSIENILPWRNVHIEVDEKVLIQLSQYCEELAKFRDLTIRSTKAYTLGHFLLHPSINSFKQFKK